MIATASLSAPELRAYIDSKKPLRRLCLRGGVYQNMQLSGLRFDGVDATGASFTGSDMRNVVWQDCVLDNANFDDTQLEHGRFDRCSALKISLARATAPWLTVSMSVFRSANFERADLTRADCQSSDFSGAMLASATMRIVSLRDCQFHGNRLDGACWDTVQTMRCDFTGASFCRAHLTHCAFLQAVAVNTNFSEVIAPFVSFAKADVSNSYFVNAALQGAKFDDALLNDVDLTGSDLSMARFVRARAKDILCVRTMLAKADFSRANFAKADFSDALVNDAIFHAFLHENTVWDRCNRGAARPDDQMLLEAWNWQPKKMSKTML